MQQGNTNKRLGITIYIQLPTTQYNDRGTEGQ